jgi:hypothetical protein
MECVFCGKKVPVEGKIGRRDTVPIVSATCAAANSVNFLIPVPIMSAGR